MTARRERSRPRGFEDTEEGFYQYTPDADHEYGSRMSNLVMEFSRMGSSDRQFLRVLLDSGGGIDHGSAQIPHTSEVRHRVAFTPEPELYPNPERVLYTPSQPPTDSELAQRLGHSYRPIAVSQTLFPSPVVSGCFQRPSQYQNNPPVPQIPAPPASGFSSPVPPKLGFFSGEGHKNEASYPQWKSEVESVLKTGIYSEAMVITNVRRSLRGRAADVVLAMGSDVTVRQILDKFDVRFGDIFPNDVTLEQFFTARQLPSESMAAWGCRLEDLLSRVRDLSSASAARSMLRSRYWSGIYSDRVRNALRHHFDDGVDFESLLKHARIAEQEPSSAVVQQSVVDAQRNAPDKLDQILAQLRDLNARVQELEKTCFYGDSSVPPGLQQSVAPTFAPAVPPRVSNSRPFKGNCYDCGVVGHRRGSPECSGAVSSVVIPAPGNE